MKLFRIIIIYLTLLIATSSANAKINKGTVLFCTDGTNGQVFKILNKFDEKHFVLSSGTQKKFINFGVIDKNGLQFLSIEKDFITNSVVTIDGNKANMVMSVFKMNYDQVKSTKINKKSKFDKPEKKVRQYNIDNLKDKDLKKEIDIHSLKVKTFDEVVNQQSLEGIVVGGIFECKIKY